MCHFKRYKIKFFYLLGLTIVEITGYTQTIFLIFSQRTNFISYFICLPCSIQMHISMWRQSFFMLAYSKHWKIYIEANVNTLSTKCMKNIFFNLNLLRFILFFFVNEILCKNYNTDPKLSNKNMFFDNLTFNSLILKRNFN